MDLNSMLSVWERDSILSGERKGEFVLAPAPSLESIAMPTLLWSFVQRNGFLYIKSGEDVKCNYGAVLDVKAHKENAGHIKVKVSMMDRPRQMSLAAFSWDENTLCQQFCSSGDNKEFIKVWKEKFFPHIDPDDGSFLPPLEQPTTPEAQERKRKSSCTPPSLLPATKAARILQAQAKQSETSSHFDEKEMDEEICKHFVGFFMLPVSSLFEPPEQLLVRDKSDVFVEVLKKEMVANPIGDVQPLLCIVRLKEGEKFDGALKEGYKYYTVGGNNSREALQQLLQEHPELKTQKTYTHRLCSVYNFMSTDLTLRLASKHNRAATFIHEMTTWDKISQCRKLLYELAHTPAEQEPPPKPPVWKKACAAVLSQTVEQLDDAMVFYMASLPNDCFAVLHNIYNMYRNSQLKGQHVARSKKGTSGKCPDLKGSQLKCLRGIESSVVHRLLVEVKEQQISLKELSCECISIKQLHRVQSAFVKGTNCDDWEEAQNRFPAHTTAQQLEPFKNLSFTGKTLPEPLLRFCQQALSAEKQGPIRYDADDIFFIRHGMVQAIFWKQDIHNVNPENVGDLFKSAGLRFPGFTLCIFDLPNGKTHDQWNEQAWTSDDMKRLLLMVRAINYTANLQHFTIATICRLEDMGDMAKALGADGESVELGVCSFSDSSAGKNASMKCLHESASGLLITRCGNPPPLRYFADNSFHFAHDTFCVNDATGRLINATQKPVVFFGKLIDLYTTAGEWVFDGLSGTGSSVIASMKKGRNCLAVEIDAVQFIHSKVRATTQLGIRNQTSASTKSLEDTKSIEKAENHQIMDHESTKIAENLENSEIPESCESHENSKKTENPKSPNSPESPESLESLESDHEIMETA